MAEKLIPKDKKGGKTSKNWIQKAVNPEHKGYCTPMTKATCTPRRKALAMTFKKHHGFHKKHQEGGTVEQLVERVNKKPSDFIQRLLDPNRKSIPNWANKNQISTHKMSWATDDTKKAIVYPQIQNVGNKLVDYSAPNYSRFEGLRNAILTGDTIQTTPKLAKKFTSTYKNYYKGFKQGGSINYDITEILNTYIKS